MSQEALGKTDYLLIHLMEECSEVIKECSKALRFGLDDTAPGYPVTPRQRLIAELQNLNCIITALQHDGVLPIPVGVHTAEMDAKGKAKQEYARSRGRLK